MKNGIRKGKGTEVRSEQWAKESRMRGKRKPLVMKGRSGGSGLYNIQC